MPQQFFSVQRTASTYGTTKNSEVLHNVHHRENREPPILPRRPSQNSGWLFVQPCGTPLDFWFSSEVRPDRKKYWTTHIQKLGGRVLDTPSPPQQICCIIVPDSRLWTPSAVTMDFIKKETDTCSVVFEEWIELCTQRWFILPPCYTRIILFAEYARISNASSDYLNQLKRSALLPVETKLPSDTTIECLHMTTWSLHPSDLFSLDLPSPTEEFTHQPQGMETSIASTLLATLTLGSPFRTFNARQWANYLFIEQNIINGTQPLFRKALGYWPCHPLGDLNRRGPQQMTCLGDTIGERRTNWIDSRQEVMNVHSPVDRDIPNISRREKLSREGLNSLFSRDLGIIYRRSQEPDPALLAEDEDMEDEAKEPVDEVMDDGVDDPMNGGDNDAEGPRRQQQGNQPLTEEQQREACEFAEEQAAQAQADGVREASEDIEDELRESVSVDADEPEPAISIPLEPISLSHYTRFYQGKLTREVEPARRRGVAAELLSGYTDSTKTKQYGIKAFPQGYVTPQDCQYTIDVDSIMASFQPTDPFPFRQTANVQLYPIGRFDRRVVGTSKFTICPSDEQGVNNLSWNDRYPVHHYANTPFLLVDGKTEVHAVFPRLRDTSPGRKTSAIELQYIQAFYDEVVRPSAEAIFGQDVNLHWPLTFAHQTWRDRLNGRMLHSLYSLRTGDSVGSRPIMEAFLQKIDETIRASENPNVQALTGIRFYVQVQNIKLQTRVRIMAEEGAEPGQIVTEAINRAILRAFSHWIDEKPADTHVDLALEITSKDSNYDLFPMVESHRFYLQHYQGIGRTKAKEITRMRGRKSEQTNYKCHRMSGVSNLAGMHYRTKREVEPLCRELKLYGTGKAYFFSSQSENKIQGPGKISILTSNTSIQTWLEKADNTLIEASIEGQNAIRIEWTFSLERARAAIVLPSREIYQRIAKVKRGLIPEYQQIKLKAIAIIQQYMTTTPTFKVAREHSGPLTLLAAFHWYIKALFSRVSHLNSDDRQFFIAIGGETRARNPYRAGQIVITMARLWSHDDLCPAIYETTSFSTPSLLRYFKLSKSQELSNLIAGRAKNYQASAARLANPDVEYLFQEASLQSERIEPRLQRLGPENVNDWALSNSSDDPMHNLTLDEVVEAVFVLMTRNIWYRMPAQRRNGKDVANLAIGINVDDVRRSWGVKEFRFRCERVLRMLSSAGIAPETKWQALWDKSFETLFGSLQPGWQSTGSGQNLQKLVYFQRWSHLMGCLSDDLRGQGKIFSLMRGKFNSLLCFPQLKKSGDWYTKKDARGLHCPVLIPTPSGAQSVTESMLTEGGYVANVMD